MLFFYKQEGCLMSNLTIKRRKEMTIIEMRVIKMLNGQIRDIRNKGKNKAKSYPEENLSKILDKID